MESYGDCTWENNKESGKSRVYETCGGESNLYSNIYRKSSRLTAYYAKIYFYDGSSSAKYSFVINECY